MDKRRKYYHEMMVYQEETEIDLGYRSEVLFPFENMVHLGLLRADWEAKAITREEYNAAMAARRS